MSALALHSTIFWPPQRRRTVYCAVRESEEKKGGCESAEHAARPWVKIDAKRVLILRRTRVDTVSASYLLRELRTDAPDVGWLEPGSGVGEVAVGLGFLFRTSRVPPAA